MGTRLRNPTDRIYGTSLRDTEFRQNEIIFLGIPENFGGSKTKVFGFSRDRLNNRENGWTFKFFIKGERK